LPHVLFRKTGYHFPGHSPANQYFILLFSGLSLINSTWLIPWYLTRLAEAQAKIGHSGEAWQRIFEAFEQMEKGGVVQHQAEINR
jgi:hypothetical protein